jgi:hypothetical protein
MVARRSTTGERRRSIINLPVRAGVRGIGGRDDMAGMTHARGRGIFGGHGRHNVRRPRNSCGGFAWSDATLALKAQKKSPTAKT